MWTNIPKHVRAFRKRAVPISSTTDNPASSTNPTTTDHPAMTTYAEPVPKVRELRSHGVGRLPHCRARLQPGAGGEAEQ